MRRWLVVFAALVLAAPAIAQLNLRGVGGGFGAVGGGGGCTGGYTGIGDVQSGAKVYLGLRAYSTAVCGTRAINIRRASDNTTTDINTLTSNGKLDTTTASTFCASTSCFITKFYDQSANGNDVSQSIQANQPALTFNCINTSLPCATFNGSSQFMAGAGCPFSVLPATEGFLAERTGSAGSYNEPFTMCQNATGAGNGIFLVNSANTWSCTFGTQNNVALNENVWHSAICGAPATSGNGDFVADGTDHNAALGNSFATGNPMSLGANMSGSGGVSFFNGNLTEAFVYASLLTVAKMQAQCHNQNLFYGTPSC